KNMSGDTIVGPVKVRVLALESQLGVAEITNADNGEPGTGAVWDFSPTLPGVPGHLGAMQISAGKPLTLRVTDLRALGAWRDLKPGIVRLDTRVYGKRHKTKAKEPEKP